MHVDHVIPEKVKPDRLAELINQYGLPQDYDVREYYNLVASCSRCNGRKGINLPSQKALLLLAEFPKIAAIAEKVKARLKTYGKENYISTASRLIEKGLKDGITGDQWHEILDGIIEQESASAGIAGSIDLVPKDIEARIEQTLPRFSQQATASTSPAPPPPKIQKKKHRWRKDHR